LLFFNNKIIIFISAPIPRLLPLLCLLLLQRTLPKRQRLKKQSSDKACFLKIKDNRLGLEEIEGGDRAIATRGLWG